MMARKKCVERQIRKQNKSGKHVPVKMALKGSCNSGVAQRLACWAHNPRVRGLKPRSAKMAGFALDGQVRFCGM